MSKWLPIRNFLLKPSTLVVVYTLLAIVTTIQLISLGTHLFEMPKHNLFANDIVNNPTTLKLFVGNRYTDYNNFVIFKRSFFHLLHGQNLYTIYPHEQWDLFKYSPTFALLMAPLAYLPDWAGLFLWTLINALALLAAIRMLPFKSNAKSLLLWFLIVELLTSLQNAQSNALLAGLIIGAFGCMQRGKTLWAALWLVLATYIKVYGAVGFCLFLFYPDKLKFVLYAALWTIIFAITPVIVTPLHTLVWQYQNWAHMMAADQSASYGLSVMGWLHSWFGLNRGKNYVMLIGIILFFLPFVRWQLYKNETYRLLMLAATLIWVIIFNYKAESPTFIIAVAGVGIWYFVKKPQIWRTAMLGIVFVFTCLTVTDIFPHSIKDSVLVPYSVKVVPCILLWLITLTEIIIMRKNIVS